jgi:phosphodiesterase/alkaline phosphatase D-like protein
MTAEIRENDTLKMYKMSEEYAGEFKTFPVSGEHENLSFSFASCQRTFSLSEVFHQIAIDNKTHFFIQMGDIHYSDIGENQTLIFD